MTMPEEIRRNDLERDRLLQVNRSLPGRPSITVIQAPSGLKERVCTIAQRAHQDYGCFGAEEGCPFCELLALSKP